MNPTTITALAATYGPVVHLLTGTVPYLVIPAGGRPYAAYDIDPAAIGEGTTIVRFPDMEFTTNGHIWHPIPFGPK